MANTSALYVRIDTEVKEKAEILSFFICPIGKYRKLWLAKEKTQRVIWEWRTGRRRY